MLFNLQLRRNGSVDWVELAGDELGLAKLGAWTVRQLEKWRFAEDRKTLSPLLSQGMCRQCAPSLHQRQQHAGASTDPTGRRS